MDEKFLLGVILGMTGGALLVNNCSKAKKLVQEGQQKVTDKINEITKKSKNSEQE